MTHEADYKFWRDSLAGKILPVPVDQPQCGFFRQHDRGGGWERIAIWRDISGEITAAINGELRHNPHYVWNSCANKPITEELYFKIENGGEWPDTVPGLGHNKPEELNEIDALREQIENASALVDNYNDIETKDECDQAANLRSRLNSLSKQAEMLRVAEKSPHDLAAKAVQAKWKPIVDAAKSAADALRLPMGVFMRKRDKANEEAAEAAQAEVEKKRNKQEEETARAIKSGGPVPIHEEIEDAVKAAPVKAGGNSGRRAGLRTKVIYEMTDYEACLEFVKNQPDVQAAVEKAGARLAKAGTDVPGIKTTETKVTA